MKIRFIALFFFIFLFLNCGMRIVECGSPESEIQNLSSTQIGDPKSKISRDEAIKLFTDANEKYLQAAKCITARNNQEAELKLKEAVSQYETILTHGFGHGQIYYNLGNTYYRKGELGRAILNYRKAQRLTPRNADLNANLRLAKNSTEDKELPNEAPVVVRRIFFWFFLLNGNELILLAVSLYVVLMLLLFFLIVLKYSWLKRFMIGFSVGLFVAVVSLGIKIYTEQGVSRGVVTASKCQVRYGPGEEYEPKFEIHDGAECLIEGERDDWYNVYVFVGVKQDTGSKTGAEEKVTKEVRKGWLQKKNVGVI
ncbi:MAG: tetratricopeptide repeat protein [Planctomycetes bacterium]|nr:tetratricopeptide repeat protein [Planctomycetota bacterium]